jgi:folylpolyglutamate synthase/dihydropteroate synthase
LGIFLPVSSKVICRHGARVHASVVSCPSFDDLSDRLLRFDHDVYEMSSLASYQKNNAALALESAWLLGIPIHNEITKQALCRAHWAGRFEIVSRDPLLYWMVLTMKKECGH